MGLLDTISKITDPADFFGARAATDAAESAKELGGQSLAMQQDWMDYMKAQSEPFQESALRALPVQEALIGLSGPEAQATEISSLQSSPFFSSMVDQGEQSIARNALATGGLRGGSTQNALAQNSQNVLRGLYDARLQSLSGLSGRGLQSQQLGQQGGTGMINQMTGTMGEIGNIGINQAAQQQNNNMGLLGAVASFFSDERLKTNINKIGEKNGLPFYEWEWNSVANDKFGLEGKETGHMVSDVKAKYPHAVGERDGYSTVDYAEVERSAG